MEVGIWDIRGKKKLAYGRLGVKKLGIWDIGFPVSPPSIGSTENEENPVRSTCVLTICAVKYSSVMAIKVTLTGTCKISLGKAV